MSDREAHGDCSLFEEFVAVGRNIYKGGKKAKIPLLSGLQSQGRSLLTECARMLTASSCCPSPIDQSVRKVREAGKRPLPHHVYMEEPVRTVVSCEAC